MVGGQHAPTALKRAGGSFVQPLLDQTPDSPSPVVLTVTDKAEPGLHPFATWMLKQNFQFAAEIVPWQLSPKLSPGFVLVQRHEAPEDVSK
jgi:hypothetical protein